MDTHTVTETARMLGLSVTRVRQLFDRGTLTGMRTPYGRLVSNESIQSLIAERNQQHGN